MCKLGTFRHLSIHIRYLNLAFGTFVGSARFTLARKGILQRKHFLSSIAPKSCSYVLASGINLNAYDNTYHTNHPALSLATIEKKTWITKYWVGRYAHSSCSWVSNFFVVQMNKIITKVINTH